VRFTTSYFLFILYSIAVFGQIVPIASDFISHSFSEAIHIATVHAKYGSNHLEKEVENVTHRTSNNHSSARFSDNFEVHVPSEDCSFLISFKKNIDNFPPHAHQFLTQVLVFRPSPPPRFT